MSSYVTIVDEFNGKGLSATQKIALALIHGFSQNRQGAFTGDIEYISWWLGINKRNTRKLLNKLEDMGLIERTPCPVDKRRYEYRVTDAIFDVASDTENGEIEVETTPISAKKEVETTAIEKQIEVETTAIEKQIEVETTSKKRSNQTKIEVVLAPAPYNNTIDNTINNTIHSSTIIAQKNVVSETTPISSKVEALQQAFSDSLTPFRDKYPVEMLEAFCDYWAAPLQNPKPSQVKAGILLKYQTQETWSLAGRLRTWAKRDSTYLGYQGQYSRAPDGPRVNSRGETRMVESYRKANEAFKALLNPENNQSEQ